MLTRNFNHNLLRLAIATVSVLVLSCTGTGNISGGDGSSGSGSISLSAVYPTSSGLSWTAVMSAGRYYIKGLNLTLYGTCDRGVQTIRVNEGGPDYPETATCQANGTFTFNKTYTAGAQEGDKTLSITAYDLTDTIIAGATATASVRIDATAPAVPVVTDPAATPYTYPGAAASYLIQGTCSADTDHLTGPSGTTIACAANAWSYTASLSDGAALNFTFYSWDLAGNQSAGVTQQILFNPSITAIVAGTFPGTIGTDGGTTYSIESTVHHLAPGEVSDAVSTYLLDPGPNYATNSARAN